MEPSIRFCTSRDGTQLAYATLGHGYPLLHLPGFSTNVELEWKDKEIRAWMERVAADRLLVRCQRRGVGASQRNITDLSLAAQVDDIAAVLDHLRFEHADILAAYDAVPVALAYSIANPERVSHLVLWAAFTRGVDVSPTQSYNALADLARQNWRLFLRTWADLCFPSGPPERQRWYSDLVRHSVSPDTCAAYIEFMRDVDVGDSLSSLHVPALVLHRGGDRYVPPSFGRATAAALPEASFVPLEGDIGLPVVGDSTYIQRMIEFLDAASASDNQRRTPDDVASPFRTVLFTDIVGHTEMMQRLGDAKGRDVLREHERITRETLKVHGGAEVKTMGDGFMASFGSVTSAMECAIALQRAFASHTESMPEPLYVRVGLNAGEPIEEDGDLFGATVILASRIAAKAGAGEILVPDTVRGLLSGKGFVFGDRGEFVPKGFDEGVRLWNVRWQE
jgi:class 3 adenylate cyclase/pimeloyl-ACP methyl ester carboxylesterase